MNNDLYDPPDSFKREQTTVAASSAEPVDESPKNLTVHQNKAVMNPVREISPNILMELDLAISNFKFKARQRIMQYCNWSMPTYYRKKKEVNGVPPVRISYAEMKVIANIITVLGREFNQNLDAIIRNAPKTYQGTPKQ